MPPGGACVACGTITLGHRVIKTVGKDLTELDFHMAFCTELASTLSIVLATMAGLPVSSTHCQVGAVVFIGIAHKGRVENLKLIAKISFTWIITIPCAALLSAAVLAVSRDVIQS